MRVRIILLSILSFLIFLSPFGWLPYVSYNLHDIMNVIFIFYLFSCLIFIISEKKLKIPKNPIPWILLVFLIFIIPGFLLSNFSFGLITSYISPIIFFFTLFSIVRDENSIRLPIKIFIFAMVIHSIYTILVFLDILSLSHKVLINYPAGFLFSGTTYVNTLALAIPLSLGFWIEKRGLKKNGVLWCLTLLILLFGVVLGLKLSRYHGLAGLIGIISTFVVFSYYQNIKTFFFGLLSTTSLLSLISPMQAEELFNFIREHIIGRIYIWKTAIDVLKHNFIVGIGFNNFSTIFPKFASQVFLSNKAGQFGGGTHNLYLHLMVESGIFSGIVLLLFAILSILLGKITVMSSRAGKFRVLSISLYCVIITGVILSLFQGKFPFLFYRSIIWWFSLVALLQIHNMNKKYRG